MRLLENSSTRNVYSSLTEDFWNPCEYFNIIRDFDIDMNKWNNASQEERDAMVRPKLEEFWKQYGKEIIDKGMLETLFDDLEDSNFHTEYRILRDIIDNENLNESVEDMSFEDKVKRDFQIFIEDKYDVQNAQDLADRLEHVTEEDVNDYFTGMFYEIWDNDDLDSANKAEEIIRREYGLLDDLTLKESTDLKDRKDVLVMYNPSLKKEVVIKKIGNKWVDNEGEEYPGDKSIDDLRSDFTDGWKRIMSTDDNIDELTESAEEISFDEIERRMSNATTYDELYAAVDLIQNPSIRLDAEQMLQKCEQDGDDVDVAYSVTTTEYIDPYWNEENVYNESAKTLKEDSVVWSNTATEDYYSNLTREEMIKEIKDNGWDEEEINGKPILDADDEELRDYLIPQDIDLDYEDYENSIEPMIEKQIYGDYVVLCGIAANWRGKGEACKAIKIDELKNYLMPNYDAHIKLMCDNQDNLYYTESNHDTPMGGTNMYLYGFLDETAYDNAEKEMQRMYKDDSFDMYYFCDWLGYSDAEELIKSGLLKNIKRDPQYVGLTESAKPKKKKKENKEDKRVIMQQGNVTCFKENDSTYYVFENESDNEVEYNNQEDAMQDFMERVGVNPNNELKEE